VAKKNTAKTLPMRILEQKGIAYQAHQQAHKQYTCEGVAEDLGVPVAQVVKAMIVQRTDRTFALFVLPGDRQLSLKKVCAALGDKNAALAQAHDVERVTGYPVGAVSVLGYRREDVPTFLDRRLQDLPQVIISAGRPDMGLSLRPEDLLQALPGAQIGDFCS